MTNPQPDVAFAAVRAAVFLGDTSAQKVLMQMAMTPNHQFQVAAVQTLAKLPPSPEIDQMLRALLAAQRHALCLGREIPQRDIESRDREHGNAITAEQMQVALDAIHEGGNAGRIRKLRGFWLVARSFH